MQLKSHWQNLKKILVVFLNVILKYLNLFKLVNKNTIVVNSEINNHYQTYIKKY